MNNFLNSKFKGICSETGKQISKGDPILYDLTARKAYCSESKRYKSEYECQQTAYYIQAQEDAYFDNFCIRNDI